MFLSASASSLGDGWSGIVFPRGFVRPRGAPYFFSLPRATRGGGIKVRANHAVFVGAGPRPARAGEARGVAPAAPPPAFGRPGRPRAGRYEGGATRHTRWHATFCPVAISRSGGS